MPATTSIGQIGVTVEIEVNRRLLLKLKTNIWKNL
ncbi:MAG: hypothetical protein JWR38_5366 [Mucilaginibacter sp.]|nr:hypothetical protein [Mucilaginibacter sp.]